MIRTALGVAAATALLAVSIAGAAGSPRHDELARTAAGRAATIARIQVGGTPSSIVATRKAVWVATGLGGVIRVDPATNGLVARLRPDGAVIDLARGFGAIWAIDLFGDRLLRIDPRTNRVTDRVAVPAMPSAVATGHGLVWVASQLDSTLVGVDPSTGRVVKRVEFAYGELWPGGLAVSPAGVWVIAARGSELVLIDPTAARVVRRVPVVGARSLAMTGETVWVGLSGVALVGRVSADRLALVSVAGYAPNGYGPLLFGGRSLWMLAGGRLVELAVAGHVRSSARVPAVATLGGFAIGRDAWVAGRTTGTLLRIRRPTADERAVTAVTPSGWPNHQPKG